MSDRRSPFSGVDIPNDDVLTNCMHCGLCLPVCPTFSITGREKSSPRGRIRLIKSVAEGSLEWTEGFIDEMNFCLDCQACETACPAGVRYGSLVEATRNQIRLQKKESLIVRWTKWLLLRKVLSSQFLLKSVGRVIRFFQKNLVMRLLAESRLAKAAAPQLTELQKLAPVIDVTFFDEQHPEILRPAGEVRYRVGFLTGCIMNVAFGEVHNDTVKVLLHHGCEVVMPKNQVCCGSLQAHNGDFDIARDLARKNIDAFLSFELDAIVMNSAGCGALMKEYGHYLQNDTDYAAKAELVSSKVKDLSEFLSTIGLKRPDHPFPHRVSYHDACHLVHSQKISQQPRVLLRSIPSLEFVELPEASWCCGSAGIYNVTRFEDSMKILDRKISHIRSTDAEFVVANNPGCISQIEYGCSNSGLPTKTVHLATLLRMAYRL